jgi:cyclopropane-fatty-acyl-phospholipid synthase
MRATPLPSHIAAPGTPKPAFLERLARRVVLRQLERLQLGTLTLIDQDRTTCFGQRTAACTLSARVQVHDPRFYTEVAFGGTIGAGEAYMQGFWSCDDLTAVVRIMVQNRELSDGMETGLARLTAPLQRAFHRWHQNSKRGSRRNIAAHYDLGNELFALFLDPTMMYSCALFEREDSTLEQAAEAKLDRVCQKLQLSPSDQVLEIGTGWGGFALHAARRYGCRVTTTTISRQQHDLAVERIREAGLDDRVTVLLKDYRELNGQYDKLVSIEMIEAVGHAYYDTFFRRCSELLKPDGMMLLQAITIADQRYEQAKRSVDFMQRYIFPGSCIPSVTAMTTSLTRATDMRLFHLEDIGPHYARTLREWRERFFANLNRVRALGYPETFIRMWEFYLCYCEGGFAERATGDVHMLLAKPACRRDALVASLGSDKVAVLTPNRDVHARPFLRTTR